MASSDKKPRTSSRPKSQSRPIEEVVPGEGLRDSAQNKKALKKIKGLCKEQKQEGSRWRGGPCHPHLESEASRLFKTTKWKDKRVHKPINVALLLAITGSGTPGITSTTELGIRGGLNTSRQDEILLYILLSGFSLSVRRWFHLLDYIVDELYDASGLFCTGAE